MKIQLNFLQEVKQRQENHLYGHTDTCLANIDSVYLIINDKKKKLEPGTVINSKIKEIFIVCKVKLFYNIKIEMYCNSCY